MNGHVWNVCVVFPDESFAGHVNDPVNVVSPVVPVVVNVGVNVW